MLMGAEKPDDGEEISLCKSSGPFSPSKSVSSLLLHHHLTGKILAWQTGACSLLPATIPPSQIPSRLTLSQGITGIQTFG